MPKGRRYVPSTVLRLVSRVSRVRFRGWERFAKTDVTPGSNVVSRGTMNGERTFSDARCILTTTSGARQRTSVAAAAARGACPYCFAREN